MIIEGGIMLFKKILIIGILFLFLGTCITPTIATDNIKKSYNPISSGNTLYVGGSGEGNYTNIQDAIDNASDGDTVFVYDESSPYNERLKIKKSINLIGENRETTIIDGGGTNSSVVQVLIDWVNISGFTIQNSGDYGAGVYINSTRYINIIGNIILNNWEGIYLFKRSL